MWSSDVPSAAGLGMSKFLAAAGPFAPIVVFLLAAAESAAFFGLVFPGELAVILGGVAAGTGSASLWVMIPAAVSGAIIGDSIGYRLGATVGPNLLKSERMARVGKQMDRAARLLSERGWWALVVARFASVLRAVVPFAAGMGNMPYRRFLLGNVIGGVAWGTTFTLVGYLAGANYGRVEQWFRRGGLAVAGLALLVGGIVWLTRWAQRNQGVVTTALRRLRDLRPVGSFTGLLRQRGIGGLALILTAAAIIGGGWLFGGLVQDVIGSEEFFFFDLATIRYLADNPVNGLVTGAKFVNGLTDPRVLVPVAGTVAIVFLLRKEWRRAAALVAATAGQWAIVEITAALIHRSPPTATPLAPRLDYGFPSEHVALLTAVVIVAAWPWRRTAWASAVRRFGLAAGAIFATGAARVVLLIEYPSDTIAAAAVSVSWALIVILASTTPRGIGRARRSGEGPIVRRRS